ncbi:MAG: hypothetical protein JF612_03745 [Planctomycetia bacterium]|jgi:hypothetical protein|nr:hypothetical protein [Planctomycetia bacterium]
MNDQNLLTLHCPQCRQLAEVVAEGDNLVCLECGWKFDEQTTARFLGRGNGDRALAPEFRAGALEGIEPRVNAG